MRQQTLAVQGSFEKYGRKTGIPGATECRVRQDGPISSPSA
jgi:hypothetical protein